MTGRIEPVLVTGATGNVGREVIRSLFDLGVPCLAAVTNPDRARGVLGATVPIVRFDLRDRSTWAPALEGVHGLFLLRPPAVADVGETLIPFLDKAFSSGVEHVAFLSVEGADRLPWVPHHAVERHLLRAGVSATLLRPGFFAQNLVDAYRLDIQERDEILVPAGRGRVAFVDVRDVAEIAARSLVEPDLRRQAWTLTGPSALPFVEVAQRLTTALGRKITYRPVSVPFYIRHLRRRGLPWGQAFIQSILHVGLRFGNAERVDPTLGRLLGRPPRSLDDFILDHLSAWTPKAMTP